MHSLLISISLLAQLVERETVNLEVNGSIPLQRVIFADLPFEKLHNVNKKISFNLNIIFLYCNVFAHFQFFVFNRSRK